MGGVILCYLLFTCYHYIIFVLSLFSFFFFLLFYGLFVLVAITSLDVSVCSIMTVYLMIHGAPVLSSLQSLLDGFLKEVLSCAFT